MGDSKKKITILGSTGTIGQNTVELILAHQDKFEVITITGNNNFKLLAQQAIKLQAQEVVITNINYFSQLKKELAGTAIKVKAGSDALNEACSYKLDLIIVGIVGIAALMPTMTAIKQGVTTIGIANKECLVSAGRLIIAEAVKYKVQIIPLDSEHNAIFQLLGNDGFDEVENIILTASGGPFLHYPYDKFDAITVDQALIHPNWSMGPKNTIDSATMVNKGLEIIEAAHLFNLPEHMIEVIIHPESIIHGMIVYNDGSIAAHLSAPTMKVPISYALNWPNRLNNAAKPLNFKNIAKLTFIEPNLEKFSALQIARHVLKEGGSAPIVFNAANEVLVSKFLKRLIKFTDIIKFINKALDIIPLTQPTTIEEIIMVDQTTREVINKLI